MAQDQVALTQAQEHELEVETVDVDEMISKHVTEARVRVPPLPPVVASVGKAASKGDSLSEAATLIEADPAISASVMRLATSPAFTPSPDRISMPYAVLRIGLKSIRGICFTPPLARAALREGPLLPIRKRVWRECVASALACEALALGRGVAPEEAYLCGLVHDFGKIVALTIIEESQLGVGLDPKDAHWNEVMEQHHCDVGWLLADRWGLASPIPEVIAMHHVVDGVRTPMLEVVRLADTAVHLAADAGWQLAAADLERIEGIQSKDEAVSLRIALAKHPFFVHALV